MMRVNTQRFTIAAASLMMFGCVGCASSLSDRPRSKKASLYERLPWVDSEPSEEEAAYPNPVKLAATWTPDTLVQTGRTPTRGFGGRIFFYDEKSRPVPVDGTLIVHGFDENADNPTDGVKRFEFTPEQFTKHFSKSDLGASYSVWIPWDAMGGERKRISLVASFKTKEGRPVQGAPTMIMLPGTKPESESNALANKLAPEYRKYQDAVASGLTRRSGLSTKTIARRRLRPTVNNSTPSITIPSHAPGHTPSGGLIADSMLAKKVQTPSASIDTFRRPAAPEIMPTSAQLPSASKQTSASKQSTGPNRAAIQALLKQ